MTGHETTSLSADQLIAQGYRVLHLKKRIIARIDRADWIDHFARCQGMGDYDRGFPWVMSLTSVERAHLYRKIWTNDLLIASIEAIKQIPMSSESDIGFIPKFR